MKALNITDRRPVTALLALFILCGLFTASPARAVLDWEDVTPDFLIQGSSYMAITASAVFNGHLYVGISPGHVGVWRTKDGVNWEQSSEEDFGNPANSFIWILTVFNDYLYAGVISYSNSVTYTEYWRTKDGLTWHLASKVAHWGAYHTQFDGYLYVGAGSSIYRTRDGRTWTKTAYLTHRGLAAFDGYLYTHNPSHAADSGVEIWRSPDGWAWDKITDNLFGYTHSWSATVMAEYDGHLYLGTQNEDDGTEVWRTADGLNWYRAAPPGFGKGGTDGNWWTNVMGVLGSQFYVGARQSQTYGTGGEIWRTGDGQTWEQANEGGFGNPLAHWPANNSMIAFKNQLYVGMGNPGSQAQIEQMGGAKFYRTANHVPVTAGDQDATTPQDTALDVDLVATDDDGDALTYDVADPPAHGEVAINGSVATYTPEPGFFGVDVFAWKVRDKNMISAETTVTVTVEEDESAGDEPAEEGSSPSGGGGGGGGCFLSVLLQP